MNFTIGTIVRLKSGGPAMTVTVVLDDEVGASWFVRDKYENAIFSKKALILEPDE